MKRLLDVSISLLAAILLSPLLIFVAAVVWRRLGRPILFSQHRIGLHGEQFKIFKFRTMIDALDANGKTLPDSHRIDSFGRFLRSTSLDELPELWNVLKGDMSLVGPRPLLLEYLPLYSAEQCRRHSVLPGITGWAQINGRNAISWEKKFKLDIWYVDNRSLWLDLKIIFMTVWRVISRHGINQEGEVTMSKFTGNHK